MNNEFRIEKNIPIPSNGNSKFPFGKMEVGDSFLTEYSKSQVQAASHAYGKYNNMKFKTRRENNGIRVWRTA